MPEHFDNDNSGPHWLGNPCDYQHREVNRRLDDHSREIKQTRDVLVDLRIDMAKVRSQVGIYSAIGSVIGAAVVVSVVKLFFGGI